MTTSGKGGTVFKVRFATSLTPRGVSMRHLQVDLSSRIQRVPCETGVAEDFVGIDVEGGSGNRWHGLRVEQLVNEAPGEFGETYLPRHVVTVPAQAGGCRITWLDGPIYDRDDDPLPTPCIFPAFQPYSAQWSLLPGSRCVFIELPPEQVDEAGGHSGSARPVQLRPGPAVGDQFIPALAETLVQLLRRDDRASDLLAESIGLALATHLAHAYAVAPLRKFQPRGRLAPTKIREFDEFIDTNLARPVSLAEMAKLFEMSVFHFAHCFKETVGISPYHYVLRRRIQQAQSLLCNRRLGVSEIAFRCGFSNQSHFADTFRRLTGTAPRQYRRTDSSSCPSQELDEGRGKNPKDA